MSNVLEYFTLARLRRYLRILLFIAKWMMRLLSASVEIIFRKNFGRRYFPMLTGALLSFIFFASFAPAPATLINLFFCGLAARLIHHFIYLFKRRRLGVAEPHSNSAGTSWDIWQRWQLPQSTVQCFIEPALCGSAGLMVSVLDSFLGYWLEASAAALFIKQLLHHLQTARRITDALDAKIEAQRFNTSLAQYQKKPSHQPQKTHRARFPSQRQQRQP